MKAGSRLTVERMVKLGRVSRSGFYRFDDADPGPDPDMELRDAIQKIAVEWPSYGRPRMTKELREREWTVNPKRVYRLMREDNLLCVRERKFVVTTDSSARDARCIRTWQRDMVPDPRSIKLWRADITYIRLRDEFEFLAVILDAYSRRCVIGWALDRTMEDSLTLTALRMALARRAVEPGLVHHSDRGSQYASKDYTDLLKANGIEISMSRKGNPWDNAACESFMKTLKYEEVLRNEYRDLADARASIREFLEKIYNQKRLHSALGYVPPARFEKDAAARQLSVCVFRGRREIFPSDGGASPAANASAHRLDEFPTGCSSAGCSPALPASASPARAPVCCNVGLPVEYFSSNGQLCLNCLCQSRGQAHISSTFMRIQFGRGRLLEPAIGYPSNWSEPLRETGTGKQGQVSLYQFLRARRLLSQCRSGAAEVAGEEDALAGVECRVAVDDGQVDFLPRNFLLAHAEGGEHPRSGFSAGLAARHESRTQEPGEQIGGAAVNGRMLRSKPFRKSHHDAYQFRGQRFRSHS